MRLIRLQCIGDFETHGSKRWHMAGMDEGSIAMCDGINSAHLQPQLQIRPLFVE